MPKRCLVVLVVVLVLDLGFLRTAKRRIEDEHEDDDEHERASGENPTIRGQTHFGTNSFQDTG
jgi:hypothetical protein